MRFEILGRPFTLKSDCDPAALEQVVRLVEDKIKEVRKELPRAANEEILVMAALNLAYDYLEIKEDCQNLRREISRRSQQLIRMIDNQGSLPLRCP